MSLLKLNLILIIFNIISANGNIFDKILQTFEGENEKINCVMVIKANDSKIVFEEATVPTIIMDLHDLPDDVEKNANVIGGHYGNEMKRASKYEDSFDKYHDKTICVLDSDCTFEMICEISIHFQIVH